jgi:hypothetical protein
MTDSATGLPPVWTDAHQPEKDTAMKTLRRFISARLGKWAMTPAQAETLAKIKFPCC